MRKNHSNLILIPALLPTQIAKNSSPGHKQMGVEILGTSGLCADGDTLANPQTQHICYMQSRMHTGHIQGLPFPVPEAILSYLWTKVKSGLQVIHRNRVENRPIRFL